MKKMESNRVLRGNYGRVWVDNELFANVKQFEAKVSLNYEDVEIIGEMGKHRRLVGMEGEGTMTIHKIDSSMARKLAEKTRNGEEVYAKIVASLDDPTAYGAERVEILEVTFDELMLMKFENRQLREEEGPFKFFDYNYIDMI